MNDLLSKFRSAPLIHKWFGRRQPSAVKEAFDRLCAAIGERGQLTILDPFVGSGSLLLEVKRRGHNFCGVDINPVAALIADYTLNPPDPRELEGALKQLEAQVGERIRTAYVNLAEGASREGVTYFHSRIVVCLCGVEVQLHHNWLIARRQAKAWAVYLCPACRAVFESGTGERVRCKECKYRFRWRNGTISNNVVKCPACRKKAPLLGLPSVRDKLRHQLVAVEIADDGKRIFRRPTEEDIAQAENDGRRRGFGLAGRLRRVHIPARGRFDRRPISHGFKTYGSLFTDRQLWALGLIAQAISEWPEERTRGALALALSDAAGSNNLLCRYAADWLKLTPAFGIHGYHPVSRPVEGNVWGASLGRGSFKNCVRKAMRAYGDLSAVSGDSTGSILLGDAASLELTSSSADAVFTDPPYFDYLDYGDLSDFYYQWLRMALPGHPWFVSKTARMSADLSMMRGEGSDSFSAGLAGAFKECLRVLKPGGPLVFSYHHSTSRGWWHLLRALQEAGLVVTGYGLVRSELNNGFHSAPGNIKSDAILVCYQREFAQGMSGPPRVPDLSEADSRMAAYAGAVQELSWSGSLCNVEDVRDGARAAAAEMAQMDT